MIRIGFFGAGKMASAICNGLFSQNIKFEGHFYSPSGSSAKKLASDVSGRCILNLDEMPTDLDIYFLAFKPQNLSDFNYKFTKDSVIVSLLAATPVVMLEKKFGRDLKLIRVMPNTALREKMGVTLILEEQSSASQVEFIFESIGEVIKVSDERIFEEMTPYSASSAAIIFKVLQGMELSFQKRFGLSKIDSRKLFFWVTKGAVSLMSKDDKIFNEYIVEIASKKGVTEAMLEIFDKNNFNKIIDEAFDNAIKRSDEIKKEITVLK
jgi:pyrroline-5-carboxylate reductase